ncbi:MAG: iron-containing redox enzyme family protein, partial [Acidimicrobiia bacterium]
ALERMGASDAARRFYDVHVTADAVHEQIAQEELVAGMLESEPATAGMILFGARALVEVERMFAQHLLHAWTRDTTSLRGSLDQPTQRLVRGAS